MNTNDFIDKIGIKYGYDIELVDALKRCVPAMIEGKNEEEISLLMDTLERVQIYTFDKQPKEEEILAIKNQKLNGRNDHVKFISCDKGEYEKADAPGAYMGEPVFDENMNIVDRVGVIYLTNLYSNSETAKFYGTKINLSHLIHELGHAWAAQKDEFIQEENGDYINTIGAVKFYNKVDRETCTSEEIGVEGLYIEEALNSIEEEEALYRILGISDFHDIPGYVSSEYQGAMTAMMRYYIEKLGKSPFENLRIHKDRKEIDQLQEIFDETDFAKSMKESDRYTNKEKKFESVQKTSMSDDTKKYIKDFFEEYRELYFTPPKNTDFLRNLDNTMEQLYNFNSIKYNYDITREDISDAYSKTQVSILSEGYVPVNQATEIIEKRKEQERPQVTLSSLAKEALKEGIRKGEIQYIEEQELNNEEEKTKDERSM